MTAQCDDAQSLSERMGRGLDVVLTILDSHDRYLLGLGIIQDDLVMETTAARVRRAHPDLFPAADIAARRESTTLARIFIQRDTGFGAQVVDAVMDADDTYPGNSDET